MCHSVRCVIESCRNSVGCRRRFVGMLSPWANMLVWTWLLLEQFSSFAGSVAVVTLTQPSSKCLNFGQQQEDMVCFGRSTPAFTTTQVREFYITHPRLIVAQQEQPPLCYGFTRAQDSHRFCYTAWKSCVGGKVVASAYPGGIEASRGSTEQRVVARCAGS